MNNLPTRLLAILALCTSTLFAQKLPGGHEHLYFGMSISTIEQSTSLTQYSEESFRVVYSSDSKNSDVNSIFYYFAQSEKLTTKPLYELIFVFDSKEVATRYGESLYGAPNAANNEWRWLENGVQHGAWVFMNKLVVARAQYGSEWEGGIH